MSRLLWVAGWVGVAVWSLLAFAAYGLVDVVGQAAMRNADIFSADPETVEWIFGTFSWARGLSVSIILVVWGVVSLAILAVPWLFDRLASGTQAAPRRDPRRDGVIDLAPGDYGVRPSAPADRYGGPSAVPRIPPPR